MIKERFISIWNKEGLSGTKLEQMTGIDRYKWGNVRNGKQRITEDMIENIASSFPQYAYWLVTGKTIPESGQVSPELEEVRAELKQTGTDTQ